MSHEIKGLTTQRRKMLRLHGVFLVLALWASVPASAQVNLALPDVAGDSSRAYSLKVSTNGRYMVDQNNIPFLMVGDSPKLCRR